jgi:hypothetical protein
MAPKFCKQWDPVYLCHVLWSYKCRVQWVHGYGIDCNVPASILQAMGHVPLSNMGICTSFLLFTIALVHL